MKRRPYAGEVTKDYLKKLGIEFVSTNGTIVIKNGKLATLHVNKNAKKPYANVQVYDPDLRAEGTHPGEFCIGVHVLNYVWNKQDKPAGMVIDHIDNDPRNNDLMNLQCITISENLAKEKSHWHTTETKCKLNKPRSFYEDKLKRYELMYEAAKQNEDADKAHKLRSYISQCRARLRYYDSHIEEAKAIQAEQEKLEAQKREYHERAQKLKELKANVNSARKYYKEVANAYGKDDEIAIKYWGEWKLAIAMLHGFQAETKVEL